MLSLMLFLLSARGRPMTIEAQGKRLFEDINAWKTLSQIFIRHLRDGSQYERKLILIRD